MNWSHVLSRNAADAPDADAVIFGDRRLTYRQLERRAHALARGLLDLGVGRGDVVAILLYNCLEYIELTFGVNQIGAVWLPPRILVQRSGVSYSDYWRTGRTTSLKRSTGSAAQTMGGPAMHFTVGVEPGSIRTCYIIFESGVTRAIASHRRWWWTWDLA